MRKRREKKLMRRIVERKCNICGEQRLTVLYGPFHICVDCKEKLKDGEKVKAKGFRADRGREDSKSKEKEQTYPLHG
jgi:uncharacterized OB-fold protein